MEPVLFGPGRDLFGMFHASPTGHSRGAVLICPPMLGEHFRTHRILRETAALLSQEGFDVLRFDYRGTGDSARSFQEMKPGDWVDDIATAVGELAEVTGSHSVRCITVRLSQLLAVAALKRVPVPIERFVSWDPVGSGAAYIDELKRQQENYLAAVTDRSGRPPSCGQRELMGFEFGEGVIDEIAAIDITRLVEGQELPSWISICTLRGDEIDQSVPHIVEKVEFECEWATITHNMIISEKIVSLLGQSIMRV